MTSLEKEVLSKVKSGDEKAFEFVFKSYYTALCAYACDLLKLDDEAEEIVQEVLIKFWEFRDQIEITTSIKAYLYRSVHNQCLNFIRHSKVIKSLSDKFSEEIIHSFELTLNSDAEFTLDYYFYDGIEQDIQNSIHELPDQCRRIFQLSRFERLRHDQIAELMGISVNTVKTQIARALEKLRIVIGKKIADHQNKIDSGLGLKGFLFWFLSKRSVQSTSETRGTC
jgi:RNA polymerase sigma-70 factor (ECF subfamily)